MGVMSCFRKGCDEIMCRTYVSNIGYICYDCKGEFENKYPDKYSENKLLKKFEKFMNTEKRYKEVKEIDDSGITVYDFFKSFSREN
jgi:hypothetical protein